MLDQVQVLWAQKRCTLEEIPSSNAGFGGSSLCPRAHVSALVHALNTCNWRNTASFGLIDSIWPSFHNHHSTRDDRTILLYGIYRVREPSTELFLFVKMSGLGWLSRMKLCCFLWQIFFQALLVPQPLFAPYGTTLYLQFFLCDYPIQGTQLHIKLIRCL